MRRPAPPPPWDDGPPAMALRRKFFQHRRFDGGANDIKWSIFSNNSILFVVVAENGYASKDEKQNKTKNKTKTK